MKIYDCCIYFDENLILDMRFNILNEHVDKFVVVEATRDHSGNSKKLNFDINNFQKFKEKIIYHVVEDIPQEVKNYKKGWSPNFYRENFHRDSILKAIENCDPEDLILISDADEIPNFDAINSSKIKKFALLKQKNFYYKINLQSENEWLGTGICYKKYLKSPQWLRNQKVKNYSFLKFFKIKWNIINNGGWHFSFLMYPDEIKKKIKSFAHDEFNQTEYLNVDKIDKSIKQGLDLFNRNQKYTKVNLDKTFPKFIFDNKNKYKDWIL